MRAHLAELPAYGLQPKKVLQISMQLQKKKNSNKEKRGKWSKGYIKSVVLEDRLFVSSQTCHYSCLVEHPVMAED